MLELSSLQNPKVKHLIGLRERSERDRTNLFLIEGYRELLRGIDAGWELETLFICEELFLGSNEGALIIKAISNGAEVIKCTKKVFEKLSYRDRPDGLIAISLQRHLTLNCLKEKTKGQNPFYVIAEAIEKPGNLGTILRSSDAVGVDGLIICDRCTDMYNPNVVRASVGTLFTVPTVEAKGLETLKWLKEQNISIVSATPHAKQVFTEVDLTQGVAIALGTEQLGLSELWMREATIQVRIPMKGIADSLNVAMATTLLLYETLRQREKFDE